MFWCVFMNLVTGKVWVCVRVQRGMVGMCSSLMLALLSPNWFFITVAHSGSLGSKVFPRV